mgnify:CR=1 FL=1
MTFDLVEGNNSVFKVDCNGETVFERSQEDRFPLYHEIQLRMFRRFLSVENLVDATRHKWDHILKTHGLSWDQVFMKRQFDGDSEA